MYRSEQRYNVDVNSRGVRSQHRAVHPRGNDRSRRNAGYRREQLSRWDSATGRLRHHYVQLPRFVHTRSQHGLWRWPKPQRGYLSGGPIRQWRGQQTVVLRDGMQRCWVLRSNCEQRGLQPKLSSRRVLQPSIRGWARSALCWDSRRRSVRAGLQQRQLATYGQQRRHYFGL